MSACEHCGEELGGKVACDCPGHKAELRQLRELDRWRERHTPMSGWVAVPAVIGWLTILYVLVHLTGAI